MSNMLWCHGCLECEITGTFFWYSLHVHVNYTFRFFLFFRIDFDWFSFIHIEWVKCSYLGVGLFYFRDPPREFFQKSEIYFIIFSFLFSYPLWIFHPYFIPPNFLNFYFIPPFFRVLKISVENLKISCNINFVI